MLRPAGIAVFILAIAVAVACKKEYTPEFKTILEQNITGVQKKTAKYSGYAVFYNASEAAYKVDNLVADLLVNGKDAATVYYNDVFEVKPKSEFKLALKQSFDNSDIIQPDAAGDLPKSVKVELKGALTLINAEGSKVEVPFTYSETVKLEIKKVERQEEKAEKKTERELKREARKAEKEAKNNE